MKNFHSLGFKIFALSAVVAVLLSPLAFFPQATENSDAASFTIDIASSQEFRFDDTIPAGTVKVRYNVTQSSPVVTQLDMPSNEGGINWINETFISRSGTGVSVSGSDLTGAGFAIGYGVTTAETGTMTLIYEDVSDVILQTTTIDFTVVQPAITTVNVNGGAITEGQEFSIPQGGELTVEVAGTSNYSTGYGVSVENQVDFELSTMQILIQSGTYNSVSELGPFIFVEDPPNSQTFGPFTVLITNTANITPGTYPIYINRVDDIDLVPTSTYFNMTITPPASFCGDGNVDQPNDDSGYEQCDNFGKCADNFTCDSHADCIGRGGDELCHPQAGDGCDTSCQSEYYPNFSLSAQYCTPSGGTLTGSFDVNLPLIADDMALVILDGNGFAPLSDQLEFTSVTVNGGDPFVPGVQSGLSLPSNSGRISASGVSTVEFEITCDIISADWHVYVSAIDNDLTQSVPPTLKSLAIEITNTPPVCGDGSVDLGETCDDSGESATCDADCTAVSCGDGVTNSTAGETCDDGVNNGNPGSCNATCDGIEPALAGGGGASSRGRIGERNTFGDDESGPDVVLGEDGVPEIVVTGERKTLDEVLHGSAEDQSLFDYSNIQLSDDLPKGYSPVLDSYAWLGQYDFPLDEPLSSEYVTPDFQGFQSAIGYSAPKFRDELRNEGPAGFSLIGQDVITYEDFDSLMTNRESINLTASLPFEVIASLHKENSYLATTLDMIQIMPESAEGWDSVVISEQQDRLKTFRLSLEATYADQYDFDQIKLTTLPNSVDCPSCAPYFSMAVTMYRQFLLPLEVLYSDLLCDARMSDAKKKALLKVVISNLDQVQGVVEHYLQAYEACRSQVDEYCPSDVDLESFAPDATNDQCLEEPVFTTDALILDELRDFDGDLKDALKAYRRANNRMDISASLNF